MSNGWAGRRYMGRGGLPVSGGRESIHVLRSRFARHLRTRPWLPAVLLPLVIPLDWVAITSPTIAVAMVAIPLALVLASDFARAIIFVLVFETVYPSFQNKSPALASLPAGIILLVLLILSSGAARLLPEPGQARFRWTPIDYAVCAFIALCLLSVLVSSNLTVALGGVRDELKYFILYLTVRWAGPSLSAAKVEQIARVIVWLLFIIAAFGVVTYFVAYPFLAHFANVNPGFAEQYMGLGRYSPDGGIHFVAQYRRVYSLLLSPLFTGYAAMGGALFALVLYQYRVMPRWAAAFWFTISLICLALTYTRTAMAGLAVGLLCLLGVLLPSARRPLASKLRVVGALAAGLLVSGVALYLLKPSLLQYPLSIFSTDSTATHGHYRFLQNDVSFMLAHPFGSGIGRSSLAFLLNDPAQLSVWTESWYFYVAAELGIAGFATYLIICALVVRQLLRATRHSEAQGAGNWRALGTALWFISTLVAGVAGVPFFSWMLSAAIWTLVALVVNDSTVVTPAEQPAHHRPHRALAYPARRPVARMHARQASSGHSGGEHQCL